MIVSVQSYTSFFAGSAGVSGALVGLTGPADRARLTGRELAG